MIDGISDTALGRLGLRHLGLPHHSLPSGPAQPMPYGPNIRLDLGTISLTQSLCLGGAPPALPRPRHILLWPTQFPKEWDPPLSTWVLPCVKNQKP